MGEDLAIWFYACNTTYLKGTPTSLYNYSLYLYFMILMEQSTIISLFVLCCFIRHCLHVI
jgi:hypothetical protein